MVWHGYEGTWSFLYTRWKPKSGEGARRQNTTGINDNLYTMSKIYERQTWGLIGFKYGL